MIVLAMSLILTSTRAISRSGEAGACYLQAFQCIIAFAMAFPENIKLDAKSERITSALYADNRCSSKCTISYQSPRRVQTRLRTRAPLCPSCHDTYGGNPDKRKWIREMRDFWWEFCEKKNPNPALVELNKKVDAIQ